MKGKIKYISAEEANHKRGPFAHEKSSHEKALGNAKKGGPSNKERERMQTEIKAHSKTLPSEKKNPWHGNWD